MRKFIASVILLAAIGAALWVATLVWPVFLFLAFVIVVIALLVVIGAIIEWAINTLFDR